MADQDASIAATIQRVINRILSESGREKGTFSTEDTLTDSIGLDSLDLAVMVVSLEQELGADPFRAGAAPVASFGELVALYEESVQGLA